MNTAVYYQFCDIEKKHWWFKGIYAICKYVLNSKIPQLYKAKPRILDIGCGTGLWTETLPHYATVIALDRSRQAIGICRKHKINYLIQGDAEKLPVNDDSCEIVTAIGLIEHLEDDRSFLKEVYRILEPGGFGLLLTSAYMFLWSEHDNIVHHKRRYTIKSLKNISKIANLDVDYSTYVNFFALCPILLFRIFSLLSFKKHKKPNGGSPDLFILPSVINNIFVTLLRFELWFLKWARFPFGVNILVLLHKPHKLLLCATDEN